MEDNKILAEFLGLKVYKGKNEYTGNEYYYYNNENMEDWEGIPDYNSDWNSLMEVVEKIEDLKLENGYQLYDFNITSFSTTIVDNFDGDALLYIERDKINNKSKLDTVFECCLEFVKWNNKSKP